MREGEEDSKKRWHNKMCGLVKPNSWCKQDDGQNEMEIKRFD